jgi:peptidoglycan/LPS O-acetylase OafA/YrhL
VLSSVGVEVFLFLSGMGLYFSYTKNKDTGAFLRKRFIRVLIPYLIYGSVIWFITDCVVNDRPITRYFYDLSLFSFCRRTHQDSDSESV